VEKREGGMREQSHIEAMREAVRGDFERAKERRPSIFERPAAPPVEIRAGPASDTVLRAERGPEPAAEPEPEVQAPPEPGPEAPARKRPRWAFWRR
jgi:hypothetical protein